MHKLISTKLIVFTVMMLLVASSAFAFTVPVATDIMYPVYDVLVNKLIGNGLNYIIGFIGVCVAAYLLMQQKIVPGLFTIIGGIVFLSAAGITTAFGLLF